MIVEYLVTFAKKDSHCRTLDGFHNLIRTIDGVSLSASVLRYKKIDFGYEVQPGEISADERRFYHVRISEPAAAGPTEDGIAVFEELLKSVRSVLAKVSGTPVVTLWDGLGKYYAEQAYGHLHVLENTLRKLITKFMLTNVGVSWVQDNVPREVADSIRTKNKANPHDYLYEVDFIQLSNFLFKDYATSDVQSMIDLIRSAKTADEVNLEQMKGVVPRSNWDRYFSGIVKCEGEYLRIRWEKLYETRNKVAHNRPVSKTDLGDLIKLCEEVAPKVRQAIEALDLITVSEEEKEIVSENVAATKDDVALGFLQVWNKLNHQMISTAKALGKRDSDYPGDAFATRAGLRWLLSYLSDKYHIISPKERREIMSTQSVRNVVVHSPRFRVPSELLAKHAADCELISAKLRDAQFMLERGEVPAPLSEEHQDDDGGETEIKPTQDS